LVSKLFIIESEGSSLPLYYPPMKRGQGKYLKQQ